MYYEELMSHFWQTRRYARMTSAEADLYFFLLEECRLRGWSATFECPNGIICATIGMSEPTLIDVRNRLQTKGMIKFESGQRRARSPRYSIFYLKKLSKNPSINLSINPSKNLSKNACIPILEPISNDIVSYKDNDNSNELSVLSEIELIDGGDKNRSTQEEELPQAASIDKFPDKVMAYYHEHCRNLRPIAVMTDKRKQAINARRRQYGDAAVMEMLTKAGQSTFLAGQNAKEWCADFDWLFRPNNFVKVMEGKYDKNAINNVGVRADGAAHERNTFAGEYSTTF